MGLRLTLKPGDRVIFNGCVVRNAGTNRMEIEVENRSDVIRANEVLSEAEARTPVRRIAHTIQLALTSRERRHDLMPSILTGLGQLEAVVPADFRSHLRVARERIREGDLYGALKSLGPAMAFETRVTGLAECAPQQNAAAAA